MNHSGASHLKWMAIIAGGAFVILLLLGQSPGDALLYAALLACPLMMIGMMAGGHGHAGHGGEHGTREGEHQDHATPQPTSGTSRPSTPDAGAWRDHQ